MATPEMTLGELDPAAHVEQVVRKSGTSFFWSMRLMPPDRRAAMFAVYAFCREIDDIADGDLPAPAKRAALDEWRSEIDRVYGGAPRGPIARALVEPARRFGLARSDFIALIDGMQMDADGPIVAPDWPTLRLYCARVAGAVGLLSVRIYGIPEELGRPLADSLGEAVQLTNILRDLDEDGAIGRLYLPAEALARHGVTARPVEAALADPAIAAVAAEVADAARARFVEARALLARVDRRAARPVRIIAAVYERLFDRLLDTGFAPPRRRVKLGKGERLWLALRYGLF